MSEVDIVTLQMANGTYVGVDPLMSARRRILIYVQSACAFLSSPLSHQVCL